MAGPGASELLAQTDQAPVFRSGVEVMEVDVTVVDAKGMPVRDLRAPEFTVTVDGQPRRVISAEFISESGDVGGRRPRSRAIPTCRTTRIGARAVSSCLSSIATTSTRTRFAARLRRSSGSSAGIVAGRPVGARDHSAARAVCRFHDQPRADPRRHHAHHRLGRPDVLAVQHQRLRGDHLRESIEPDRHAAAAVSRVRRYRSQHDVAVRSRRRAGSADDCDAPPAADVGSRCRDLPRC